MQQPCTSSNNMAIVFFISKFYILFKLMNSRDNSNQDAEIVIDNQLIVMEQIFLLKLQEYNTQL